MVIESVVLNSTAEPNGTVFWIFVAPILLIGASQIYSAILKQTAINAKREFLRNRRRI